MNRRLLTAALLQLLIVSAATAQRVDVVTGFEGGDRLGYLFVTSSITFNVSENVDAIPFWTVSYLYYSFVDERGTVEVRSPGTTVGVNMRWRGPRVTLTAGPAYEVRQTTRRTPTDSRSTRQDGPLLQGNLSARPAPRTTVSLAASYSFANDYTRSRARVMQQLTTVDGREPLTVSVGAEAMAHGNPEARAFGGGGVLGLRLPQRQTTLEVRVGYIQYTAGELREGRIYFGIGGSAAL